MPSLPKKLQVVPIVEAVAEIRFGVGQPDQGAVLPGFLFSQLRGDFPRFQRLPAAELPPTVRGADQNLQFAPTYRLDNDSQTILVGDHILAVAVRAPYPGWSVFKPLIAHIWDVGRASGVLEKIDRCSIKYVNLIEAEMGSEQLKLLDISISLGPFSVASNPLTFRTEIKRENLIAIVQVLAQAQGNVPGANALKTGLVLDVDVLCDGPFKDFWQECSTLLDQVHDFEKQVFFSLLKSDTLERYGPQY